jgi:SAM-dependent methyltransferase
MRTWNEAQALEWRRSFGPPVRPTYEECRVYKRELGRLGKTAKVLLMGSTPEIRDVSSEMGASLTVVDESEKHYSEVKAIMAYDSTDELFVKKNWADMDFSSEFDFVLGDNVLSILSPKDAKKVMGNIHKSLKAGGRWITRVMLYNSGEDFASPDTLNGRISACAKKKDLYENLYVPFLAYYKNEVGKVVGSEIYGKLKRDVDKGLFPQFCTEVFLTLSRYDDENYLVQREDFETEISSKFSIVRAFDNTESFSKNWVIYVLKKK